MVTSLLVMEGNGTISEEAGGFSDWEARGGRLRPLQQTGRDAVTGTTDTAPANSASLPPPEPANRRKLSYKEQRELATLPEQIEALEERQGALEAKMAEPDFYQQEHTEVEARLAELAEVQRELEQAITRWTELEDLA